MVALTAPALASGELRQSSPGFLAAAATQQPPIADEQTRVVKALQEGLGGIRDVLLDGAQPFYCDVYRRADRRCGVRRATTSSSHRVRASPWRQSAWC